MSVMPPQTLDRFELQRVTSSMQAVREFEGIGRIIHDSYDKIAYTKRRHGFLGSHPDYKTHPQLLPKVRQEADKVFQAQDELSVEKIRTLELAFEIEPLLPLPTTTNTQSLDNFRSTGAVEWTPEIGHPTHFSPSPSPSPQTSPRMSQAEPTAEDQISPRTVTSSATLMSDEIVSGIRGKLSSAGRSSKHRQTVFAGPDPEPPTQQTHANTPSQLTYEDVLRNAVRPLPSAMDIPQAALNAPKDADTMNHLWNDFRKPLGSLGPKDAPPQYQNQEHEHDFRENTGRPIAQVSAVSGRPLPTQVKPQSSGTKRKMPAEPEEADGTASGEEQTNTNIEKTVKRPRKEHPTKAPRAPVTDREDSPRPERVRRLTTKVLESAGPTSASNGGSATSSVSVSKPTARKPSTRRDLGGKSLSPEQSGSAAPVARRPSNPSTVNGNRLPKTKGEAAEAAVERRQKLMDAALKKDIDNDHPDLGPEFFDTSNFTEAEKDPNGGGPIRCVCGKKDNNYTGVWIGCDNEDCGVWQHMKCMGEGVPKDPDNDKYLCQQCDAWAHRYLIQRLRKGQPLP